MIFHNFIIISVYLRNIKSELNKTRVIYIFNLLKTNGPKFNIPRVEVSSPLLKGSMRLIIIYVSVIL